MGNIKEAKRRIEVVYSKKEKVLNLSRLKLTTEDLEQLIPIILEKIPDLQGLLLENNKITIIPERIADLAHLIHLSLYKNEIIEITPIAKLTKLEILNLNNNKVVNVNPLRNLKNLFKLELGFNQVVDTNSLAQLTKLKFLLLNNNKVVNINALGNLKNLIELNLGFNQFTDISSLAQLTKLNKLVLCGNALFDIAIIAQLTSLKKLNLANNQLEDITALSGLVNLVVLNLKGNQIRDIGSLAQLLNLKRINLSHNQLADINPLVNLIDLNFILLSYNRITHLPQDLNNFHHIELLDLEGNPLSYETIHWLEQDDRPFRARYDMAAFVVARNYEEVVKALYGDQSQEILEMINSLKDQNYVLGSHTKAPQDDLKTTGTQVLQEFLEKLPHGQGKFQKFYNDTARQLLGKIKEGDMDHVATIATALGNCATPVKSFLTQVAIGFSREASGDISPEMANILTREALETKTLEVLNKIASFKSNKNEHIEKLQGLINSVYLANAENNPNNKIRIIGERERLPSKSAYPEFAFKQVNEQWIIPFAKLCCQTNEDNKLIKEGEAFYKLDYLKLQGIREEAMKAIGMISPVEKLVDKTNTDLQLFSGGEAVGDFFADNSSNEAVAKIQEDIYTGDPLRALLLKADDGVHDLEEVALAYKNELIQSMAALVDQPKKMFKKEVNGVSEEFTKHNTVAHFVNRINEGGSSATSNSTKQQQQPKTMPQKRRSRRM